MDSIVERIMDKEKWPSLEMPENLELLNELADREFDSGTFPGMLAALLMYHQIVEALCVHLLEDCHFLIQLALYPATIHFKVDQSKMLGSYIKDLRETVDFKDKDKFIGKVEEFNRIRNTIVHKMRRSNGGELSPLLRKGRASFEGILDLYVEIQDDFCLIFHSYKKDIFRDYAENDLLPEPDE